MKKKKKRKKKKKKRMYRIVELVAKLPLKMRWRPNPNDLQIHFHPRMLRPRNARTKIPASPQLSSLPFPKWEYSSNSTRS